MSIQHTESEIFEDELMGTAALIAAPDGSVIINTLVTSWTVEVYDEAEDSDRRRSLPLYTETVDPTVKNTNAGLPGAELILNTSATPRNDGFWKGPGPGYSFLYFITKALRDAATPPFVHKGGHTYRVVYTFTTSWEEIVLVHKIKVNPTMGS